jgi:pSer/pThr/pTyr-binding forkhead associated (FHA) protein
LVIDGDNFISGSHAQLLFDQGYLILSDLNSRNGTFLNGTRLKNIPVTVKSGDKIGFGNSTFELI